MTDALHPPEHTGPIRVLMVDVHSVSRRSSRELLEALGDVLVVADCDDEATALETVRTQAVDVVLTSLRVKGSNGIELTRALRTLRPGLPVIVLTLYERAGYLEDALAAGACSYVLKDAPVAELVAALRAAVGGGSTAAAGGGRP